MLKKTTGPGLFRLFLALLVFAHHLSRFSVGSYAVYVFFCLSGFWIYKMYVGRYALTRQPYFTYMVSRAWRLLPTFLLITVLALLYVFAEGLPGFTWHGWSNLDKAHFIFSNLFILGYDGLQQKLLVPAWSLDIEMQFYLIAPLIVLLLARRRVSPVWAVLAAAAISLTCFLLGSPVALGGYLVFFVIGMAASCADWRPSSRQVLVSLGVIALLTAACLVSPWRGILLVGAHPGPLSVFTPHANAVLALLTVPYAIYTTGQKGFSADGMFADLSYVVYLLHWIATMWIYAHPGSLAYRFSSAGVACVLVLGLSYIIWKFYDHPINRMRSRWVSGRKRSALAERGSAH